MTETNAPHPLLEDDAAEVPEAEPIDQAELVDCHRVSAAIAMPRLENIKAGVDEPGWVRCDVCKGSGEASNG